MAIANALSKRPQHRRLESACVLDGSPLKERLPRLVDEVGTDDHRRVVPAGRPPTRPRTSRHPRSNSPLLVDQQGRFLTPDAMLATVPGVDTNRGVKRAREARKALQLDAAAPLECLLEVVEQRAGLSVVVATLQDGLAGACTRTADSAVLFVNGAQPHVRQRFTLAHEFGHAWCKHDGQLAVDTFETGGTLFRADGPSERWVAEELEILALAATQPAPLELDEVDRLFLGGPDA